MVVEYREYIDIPASCKVVEKVVDQRVIIEVKHSRIVLDKAAKMMEWWDVSGTKLLRSTSIVHVTAFDACKTHRLSHPGNNAVIARFSVGDDVLIYESTYPFIVNTIRDILTSHLGSEEIIYRLPP